MRVERKAAKVKFTLDVIESCKQNGMDPVSEFWKTLALVDDPAIKAKLLLELFEYIYPKRRSVEASIDVMAGSTELSHAEIKAVLAGDPFLLAAPAKDEGGKE